MPKKIPMPRQRFKSFLSLADSLAIFVPPISHVVSDNLLPGHLSFSCPSFFRRVVLAQTDVDSQETLLRPHRRPHDRDTPLLLLQVRLTAN
jgi:hypothetical protein